MKRGLTHQEAMAYVGVKRRTFDEVWRPNLVAMRQGSCIVFDRQDIDRLFDRFKQEAAGQLPSANESTGMAGQAHNGVLNERPIQTEGVTIWASQHGGFTPTKTDSGRSTNGSGALDFASAASRVLEKRKAG